MRVRHSALFDDLPVGVFSDDLSVVTERKKVASLDFYLGTSRRPGSDGGLPEGNQFVSGEQSIPSVEAKRRAERHYLSNEIDA